MKNNIVLLYSNDINLSTLICNNLSEILNFKSYIVENEVHRMLNTNKELKELIISKFGVNSYTNDKFNHSIYDEKEIDFTDISPLSYIQNIMNRIILEEINNIKENVLVVSNQLVETGLLHLTNNLITIDFKNSNENPIYISLESMKTISKHFISEDCLDIIQLSLKGCLIQNWKN